MACRLAGALATRLGQPAVVGMMFAGVLLGPSLLGSLWPAEQAWLFPVSTRGWLQAAAGRQSHALAALSACDLARRKR